MSLSSSMPTSGSSQADPQARDWYSVCGLYAPPNSPEEARQLQSQPAIAKGEKEVTEPGSSVECYHLPVSTNQHNVQPCMTCNIVTGAIVRLQHHQDEAKLRANQHLQRARQSLPRLFYDAMQDNARLSLDDSTEAEPARTKQWKQYNRFFDHWCEALGMDSAAAWSEFSGPMPTGVAPWL